MQLYLQVEHLFEQLKNMLLSIPPAEYTRQRKILSGSTIGQHVRHVTELFQELVKGLDNGTVNYENRKRDPATETDQLVAAAALDRLLSSLSGENKPLTLVQHYPTVGTDAIVIGSNYFRELVYNIEHTVHHMALIRVGLTEVASVQLPADFGVAAATIRFRNSTCAQ